MPEHANPTHTVLGYRADSHPGGDVGLKRPDISAPASRNFPDLHHLLTGYAWN